MNDDLSKVTYYVTKYALTEGIIVLKPGMARVDDTGDYLYYGGRWNPGNVPTLPIQVKRIDYHASLDEAKARVQDLVSKKLKTLDRQVRKLQTYNPPLKEFGS